MLFDPSIIADLQRAIAPPSPPAIEEPFLQSATLQDRLAAEQLDRRAGILVDAYSAGVNEWIAWAAGLRQRIASGLPVTPASQHELRDFATSIEDMEANADHRARGMARAWKKSERAVKRYAPRYPKLTRSLQKIATRLLETEQALIVSMLDLALFLRSVRADADPASKGGPAFSDPEELHRYLERALA